MRSYTCRPIHGMGPVVRLPTPMEGKGGDSNFQFFVEQPVAPQVAGVDRWNTKLVCAFSLYNSDILSTAVSILDRMGPIF